VKSATKSRPTMPATPVKPAAVDTTSEIRRRIDDMNQRITRQQRRIERILVHREGPADEMQALLDDMIKVRDSMHGELEDLEEAGVRVK
jgi:hypothetical protein